jgi:DNA helicase-2/ATP-dependent DNA helicase PcrA
MFDQIGLNAEQRRAAEHDDRPLLVLAGAGTGKTATLVARVAHLLDGGASPDRVCLLTFSRRAAAEMLTRAGHMADRAQATRVVGGTFHSLCHQLLRRYGHLVGLEPGFSLLDAADAVELIGLVRHDLGLDSGTGRRFPRKETLAAILSRVANTGVHLSDVVATTFPWCGEDVDAIRAVFAGYTARKRAQRLCDFDDLLLMARALGAPPEGSRMLSGLFDHVLVDEYQDVNALQADLVDLLRPGGRGVTAVGDDGQAIYGFRAASREAITTFTDRYPQAAVVRLEQNYRSTPPILAVANQVLADGTGEASTRLWSERPGRRRPVLRTCFDEASQAEAVCDSVLAHRELGVALRSQAVLFRAGHHADILEIALGRRSIPYVKYGGLRFVEAAHVKDFLTLLRLLGNPWDELAWFRVLRLLEGVGPATARRVMDQLGVPRGADKAGVGAADRAADGVSADGVTGGGRTPEPGGPSPDPAAPSPDPAAPSPLSRLLAAQPSVPAPADRQLADLRLALGDCLGAGPDSGPPVGVQADRLVRWLEPRVQARYDASAARCGDLERLVEQAATAPSRDRFVSDLALDPPAASADLAGRPSLDDDWLVLSTVHSAKGGEWDVVHVIHAVDGMFPSDLATGDPDALAEERRLLYVALTRARDALEINVPLRYHRHRGRLDDHHGYAPICRFITAGVQALMERRHAGPPAPILTGGPLDGVGGGVAAVDAFLAELWS